MIAWFLSTFFPVSPLQTRLLYPEVEMCEHWTLICSISPYATASSHHAYTDSQLVTAATGKRKLPGSYLTNNALEAFPAPLILPGDDIDCDPKYPPQSFRSWLNLGVRNHVTSRRNVIYLAAAPDIDVDVAFMRDWQHPRLGRNTRRVRPASGPLFCYLCVQNANPMGADGVDVNVIAAYLRTFYHGLEVKVLPQRLYFTSWEDESSARRGCSTQNQKCQQVGLSTGGEIVRIRVRSTPPADTVSPPQLFAYPYQLNLNDLTDVAMDILPSDAYALLLMTAHDIYESDDDDFCCGRAWGASRVAIVSSARYHTIMDDLHDVDGEHVWPASHCKAFVDEISAQGQAGISGKSGRKAMKGSKAANEPTLSLASTPLQKALNAHLHAFSTGITPDANAASTLLFRLCRTTSHELGHCFGLDHCMYKACVMQGSGSAAAISVSGV